MKTCVLLVFICLASLSARAADPTPPKFDWKACEKEMKEFKCSGTDKEIWQCLEKHDTKLSKSCDKVHDVGDELFE
jgi:hypothetical protein